MVRKITEKNPALIFSETTPHLLISKPTNLQLGQFLSIKEGEGEEGGEGGEERLG